MRIEATLYFILIVLILAISLSSYMDLDDENTEGLAETNEALRERVVELTAENEWLKNKIDTLEASE